MIVASIDPGVKNFAIAVELVDDAKFELFVQTNNINVAMLCSETIFVDVQSFNYTNNTRNVTTLLEKYRWVWEMCDIVLIERQMQFKGLFNNKCIRISHHCMSFIELLYPNIQVLEYSSTHKTRVLEAPRGLNKPQRKKWSIQTVNDILQSRGDCVMLSYLDNIKDSGQKLDDISDCILMCLTFMIRLYKG